MYRNSRTVAIGQEAAVAQFWSGHFMTMTWNRLVSGLVAGIYLVMAYAHGGMEPTFKIGMFLIMPLACIWFSDAMGGYTGLTMSMPITAPSPGVVACILGWLLLLLPLIIGIIIYAET